MDFAWQGSLFPFLCIYCNISICIEVCLRTEWFSSVFWLSGSIVQNEHNTHAQTHTRKRVGKGREIDFRFCAVLPLFSCRTLSTSTRHVSFYTHTNTHTHPRSYDTRERAGRNGFERTTVVRTRTYRVVGSPVRSPTHSSRRGSHSRRAVGPSPRVAPRPRPPCVPHHHHHHPSVDRPVFLRFFLGRRSLSLARSLPSPDDAHGRGASTYGNARAHTHAHTRAPRSSVSLRLARSLARRPAGLPLGRAASASTPPDPLSRARGGRA